MARDAGLALPKDLRQFANGELAACAQPVDRRCANSEATRDLSYAEQIFLDPSWTRRFVFLRCGMGDS